MDFKYKLSDKVLAFIEKADLEEISIGCSDSQVFRIKNKKGIFFLKVAKKALLTSEYEKLKWLEGKLNVPKIVLYDYTDDTEYLITTIYILFFALLGVTIIAIALIIAIAIILSKSK